MPKLKLNGVRLVAELYFGSISYNEFSVTDSMTSIVLATLNAKYIHASLGLRYLFANLGELQSQSKILEFTIKTHPLEIVESILSEQPAIVGFGVYIWNIQETFQVVAQLKAVAPEITVVLGGPEISYESNTHPIASKVDYIITGAADLSFYRLCQDLLDKRAPLEKFIQSKALNLAELALPYDYYSDDDLAHRLLYVEASRGCPFKCEFCLSALDKTSYPFELKRFLSAMNKLYQRGARHFKFVDRTFNLKVSTTLEILAFFQSKLTEDLFLHFEVIPDHLPDQLKKALQAFPEGVLQFEVGIQTFNSKVQENISRKQNNEKSKQNLIWLRENTHAHIHADLIFGLPGETIESFEQSFNELYDCRPHEIQLGILKRLKGSPIIRHTDDFKLVFNPLPPYNILSNRDVDFAQMQKMNRFTRYWDMLGNSGRFKNALPILIDSSPFSRFMLLSEWLYQTTGQTHQINLKRLFELLLEVNLLFPDLPWDCFEQALHSDYKNTLLKGRLLTTENKNNLASVKKRSVRQQRHIG